MAKQNPEKDSIREELFAKRVVLIDGDITDETAADWIGRIALLDLKGTVARGRGVALKPIVLLINCYGGDAYASLGLVDVIRNSTCPIYTVCIGVAMSGGSMILGAGKKRFSVPNAKIMIHQHHEDPGVITHHEILNIAEESKVLYKQLVDYYMEVTGSDEETVDKFLKKDTYMTATEAKNFGLIDEIGWQLSKWLK